MLNKSLFSSKTNEWAIPQKFYEWKQRTTNSYWCLKSNKQKEIIDLFANNCYVDSCTKKVYSCRFCGVCIREYFACKERMKNG